MGASPSPYICRSVAAARAAVASLSTVFPLRKACSVAGLPSQKCPSQANRKGSPSRGLDPVLRRYLSVPLTGCNPELHDAPRGSTRGSPVPVQSPSARKASTVVVQIRCGLWWTARLPSVPPEHAALVRHSRDSAGFSHLCALPCSFWSWQTKSVVTPIESRCAHLIQFHVPLLMRQPSDRTGSLQDHQLALGKPACQPLVPWLLRLLTAENWQWFRSDCLFSGGQDVADSLHTGVDTFFDRVIQPWPRATEH